MDIVDKDLNIIYANSAMFELAGNNPIDKKCYQLYKNNNKILTIKIMRR